MLRRATALKRICDRQRVQNAQIINERMRTVELVQNKDKFITHLCYNMGGQ